MSHIQKAKQIMEKINKRKNVTQDPKFFSEKQQLLQEKDSGMAERIDGNVLTEKDRLKLMSTLSHIQKNQRKSLNDAKTKTPAAKTKKKNKSKGKVESK